MCRMFIGRFVASIVALLITSSVLLTHGQIQSGPLSDEDEAEILESLIQSEIKPLGSEFGSIRIFSSDNLSSASATRIAKHGFSVVKASEIERSKQENVVDYLVIRSLYRRDGIVVIRLSNVTEGRPCFAPSFSRERSFTYEFKKDPFVWVGKLVKGPVPSPLPSGWRPHLLKSSAKPNTRLERTRRERASLLSCVGEPLKRSVRQHQLERFAAPAFTDG